MKTRTSLNYRAEIRNPPLPQRLPVTAPWLVGAATLALACSPAASETGTSCTTSATGCSTTTTSTTQQTTTTSTDTQPPPCSAAGVEGIAITPSDPNGGVPYALGYPPYAIFDCQLAYVAPPANGGGEGALVLRDLTNGSEEIVAPAGDKPRRPTLAGGVLAWEADLSGKSVVRVRKGGVTVTVQGPFDHAGEPRAAADGVVFTAFLTAKPDGDSDVYYVVPGETQASPIAAGPGQQRFADISTDFIAVSDFSEDPDLTFNENATDLADVRVYDRHDKTWHEHSRAGKQAFPMLGAQGKVAYLSWSPDHPEPKFSQYELVVGDIASPGAADVLAAEITTSSPYVRPTAHGEKLEWVEWPLGDKASLWRRPADLSKDAAAVAGFSFSTLYGPATSAYLTVAASQGENGTMTLHAAAH